MMDIRTKIKRQIEIVGLCDKESEPLTTADLADLYACEELTIKRDLQELRAYGIDIHSERRRGVRLSTALDARKLRGLIVQYLGLSSATNSVDKATNLLVKKLKEKALNHVVLLQRCIDQSTSARINYQKEETLLERDVEICPILIFQTDGLWRVLTVSNGKIKQYHLNKLLDVEPTTRHFRPVSEETIEKMFRYSFRSWIGAEKNKIVLKLSPVWAERLKPKQMIEAEKVTELEDGSVVLESTVNSLSEIAGWVVSRGEGVTVLEPEKLKTMVVELAKGTLANY
jgi:predicted DNA-binding transcriptional regulator YafY